jgi:hypothetical protein
MYSFSNTISPTLCVEVLNERIEILVLSIFFWGRNQKKKKHLENLYKTEKKNLYRISFVKMQKIYVIVGCVVSNIFFIWYI